MSAVTIRQVSAHHGRHPVLNGVDLSVPSGDIVSILGPSGCGKTTLLRTLAGLHRITSGSISIDGVAIASGDSHQPPERRSVGLVPQEGALFPHLSVAENVGFGLPRRQRDRDDRIAQMLELVGLGDLARRHPHQLSGGQQQRVAIARALAPRPALMLLDEPFSSLDAHLREELRIEVRELLHSEGATTLVVTHDRAEALSLGDTVAVMREGTVVQHAPPDEVYARPRDEWTARFVGRAVVLPVLGRAPGHVTTAVGTVDVDDSAEGVRLLLRPECLRRGDGVGVPATVVDRVFRGTHWDLVVTLSDGTRLDVQSVRPAAPAERVLIQVDGGGHLLSG
jgi:iron(III) transport system ATP-binding protein